MEIDIPMRNFHRIPALLVVLSHMAGCTYTSAIALTNIPADRSKPIQASVKKYIVLGFNFDNDQAFTLTAALKAQCPDGQVKGILTKDMTTYYLLSFYWARETQAQGYCVSSRSVADASFDGSNEITVSQWETPGEAEQ